jgi:hypothetical protein
VKRYRFTLQPVLQVLRAQEDAALRRLVAADGNLRRSQAALLLETERYQAHLGLPGPCDLESFRSSRLDAEHAAGCLATARVDVESSVSASTACRADWSDRARRVAALERLDGRRQSEWWTEFRRQEEVEVNDMVTSRWSNPAPRLPR